MATDSPNTSDEAPEPPDGPPEPPGRDDVIDEPPHPSFADYATESLPAAAVGSPGKDGRLELRFAADEAGETNLVRDLARAPFHVSGTLGHDPLPEAETVYVQSPTGGVAQGDRHRIDVEVGTGAVAHVSTQSSQKVLSMERNYAAADVSLTVDRDGHLDYVPEPTILHENSRFFQALDLDLAADASAVVGDVVVPGRLARGERFDFERYLSRLRVRRDGTLLVDDATHLRPAHADPTAAGVMGEFAVVGTLYVLVPADESDGLDDLSDRLHGVATGAVPDPETDGDAAADDGHADTVRAGATRLPNDAGCVVRALGHRAETVTASLRAAWDEARTDLLGVGAPESRRP
ncbi:urease accessory protein UreD [Halosimplex carlsbadense 2-9-1]|uniref:Urease accessory protein UreD n=1 Tax=Halosimplex carlsbadense 2-9-1 TaxID=797114 RepID=M0D4N2_9EURY|nr:urease accessory protein UreD [Halosimplex carlsbadense]ELZ29642.1 urease accessory protein UreD [Halosimplex carlsbadense 2-9-1]